MRKFCIALVIVALCLGCAKRHDITSEEVISLSVVDGGEGLLADGTTPIKLKIKVDEDTDPTKKIKIIASSGRLAVGKVPDGKSANEIEIPGGFGDGTIIVNMTLGRTPERDIITATLDIYSATATIDLAPSPPRGLDLKRDKMALIADGADFSNVTATLEAISYEKGFSEHWKIYLVACCSDPTEPETKYKECDTRPPLSVPRFVIVDDNDTAQIKVVADRIYESDSSIEIKKFAWIIGEAWDGTEDFVEPDCTYDPLDAGNPRRSPVSFKMTPLPDPTL